MILLTSTNDLVTVTTGGTQVVNVHASWVGLNGTTVTPARQNTVISSATTTTVVPSPAASTQYNLKALVITNTDATNSVSISVKHTDGTNNVTLITVPLTPTDTLTWTEDEGWAFVVNGSEQVSAATYAAVQSDWAPVPDAYPTGAQQQLFVDPQGNLVSRSTVLSDEGSFYDHFTGTSLTATLAGTTTFVNGSMNVTGSGTSFLGSVIPGQYIKLSTDSETAWAQVDNVISNTQIMLATNYTGSSAGGSGIVSNWATVTAAGGSFSVSNSNVNITNGTANGAMTYLYSKVDYPPLQLAVFCYVTGLILGQTVYVGFVDNPNPASTLAQITMQFGNGLAYNQFNLVSSGAGGAIDTITQLCSLPPGLLSSTVTDLQYKIDLSAAQAVISVGIPNVSAPQIVGTAVQDIPAPYTDLYVIIGLINNTAIASSATITCDGVLVYDVNRLEVANSFSGQPVPSQMYGKNPAGQLQPAVSDNNNALIVSTSGFEDMTGNVRGSPAVVQLGATVNQNYSLGRVKLALGNVGEDRGDTSLDGGRGLPVESRELRLIAEKQFVQAYVSSFAALIKRSAESLRTQEALLTGRTGREGRM